MLLAGQAHKSFPLRDITIITKLNPMSSKSYPQGGNSKIKMQKSKLKVKNKNWTKNIVIFLTGIGGLVVVIYYGIDFLNKNSGAIQAMTTVVLVIITGIYAYFTQKMANLMAKQVISEIKVSNVILGTPFVESHFLKKIEEQPNEIDKNSYFKFKLLFDVYNKSSGSGSIEKPTLILKFINDNFEYKIFPITKKPWSVEDSGPIINYVDDLGRVIFLKGGEFQKIELKYTLSNFSQELLKHIRENISFLEYYIEFCDNLENKHHLKVQKIQPEQDTFRV